MCVGVGQEARRAAPLARWPAAVLACCGEPGRIAWAWKAALRAGLLPQPSMLSVKETYGNMSSPAPSAEKWSLPVWLNECAMSLRSLAVYLALGRISTDRNCADGWVGGWGGGECVLGIWPAKPPAAPDAASHVGGKLAWVGTAACCGAMVLASKHAALQL